MLYEPEVPDVRAALDGSKVRLNNVLATVYGTYEREVLSVLSKLRDVLNESPFRN